MKKVHIYRDDNTGVMKRSFVVSSFRSISAEVGRRKLAPSIYSAAIGVPLCVHLFQVYVNCIVPFNEGPIIYFQHLACLQQTMVPHLTK